MVEGGLKPKTFSILERIDVGETTDFAVQDYSTGALSVSSNGSTWVKRYPRQVHGRNRRDFQYPRTRVGTVKRLITPKRNQGVMSQTLHLLQT